MCGGGGGEGWEGGGLERGDTKKNDYIAICYAICYMLWYTLHVAYLFCAGPVQYQIYQYFSTPAKVWSIFA